MIKSDLNIVRADFYSTISVCFVSLNITSLTDDAIRFLSRAKLGPHVIQREGVVVPGMYYAHIRKCNAEMVLFWGTRSSKHCLHRSINFCHWWSQNSNCTPEELENTLEVRYDEAALLYLGECAAGIYSVVLGDSQVYGQMKKGLQNAMSYYFRSRFLQHLLAFISCVEKGIRTETLLKNGNLSLERIACEILKDKLSTDNNLLIIGTGSSSSLIAKICAHELDVNVIISGRTSGSLITSSYKQFKFVEINNLLTILQDIRISAIIFAITSEADTRELVINILDILQYNTYIKPIIVIDLGSPQLVDQMYYEIPYFNIMSLSYISEIATDTLNIRQGSLPNVNDIIINEMQLLHFRLLRDVDLIKQELNQINNIKGQI